MSRLWLGLTPMPPHGKRTNMGLAEPGNEKEEWMKKKDLKKKTVNEKEEVEELKVNRWRGHTPGDRGCPRLTQGQALIGRGGGGRGSNQTSSPLQAEKKGERPGWSQGGGEWTLALWRLWKQTEN